MKNLFFTLRKKIYLLSIISAVFLIATIIAVYINLKDVSDKFRDFRSMSEFAKENISLSKKVESLKGSVIKYTYTGSKDASSDVHKIYKQIINKINTHKLPVKSIHEENFTLIKKHLEKYYKTFLELEKQLESHKKMQSKKRSLSSKIEKDIEIYFQAKTIFEQQNKELFHHQFHQIEQDSKYYFENLDLKYLKSSKKNLKSIKSTIKKILKKEQEPEKVVQLQTLQKDINKYSKTLNKEIQHSRSYQFLVNVVMAAEAYEVNHYAIEISDESQKILFAIDTNLNDMILNTLNTLVTTGVIFVSLLLLFAYLITRSIVQPISSITTSFVDLASGKTNTKVPKYNVQDEIGQLTDAASSFLEKNKEIRELLLSTEKLTDELSLNQERFSLALKGAKNGLWDWNLATDEVYYSPTWKNMFGYEDNEIDNTLMAWKELIHPEDLVSSMDDMSKYLDERIPVYESQMRILCKDSSYKHILVKGQAIKNDDMYTVRFVGLSIDITEQKKIQEDLKNAKLQADQASKAKSDFLANMSHEIRTPLNGIIGLTDLVLKTPLEKKQEDFLLKSKTSSLALLRIINDILDYSKIEAGKLDLEEKPFHLDETMKDIQNLFEYQANEKGISLHVSTSLEKMLLGDSLRITQILTNLVGNALKFTSEGSVSAVANIIEEDEHSYTVEFSVKDTGIGVKKEVQEKLFSEFSQADNSITRKFGGTGLGLAICKQLVKMMDGNIWMDSTYGEGSTITFNAKFAKVDEKDIEQHADESAISQDALDSLKDMEILLVEDNKTNQIVAMGILEDFVPEIDIANDGQEAVDMVVKKQYDLILMDLQMPVMDGFEATKHIRKIQSYKEVPIIALSAAVMKEDVKLTSEAGMNSHLSKPIDKDQLLRTLVTYA